MDFKTKPDNSHAISAINADALFILPENDLDRIVWQEGTSPIAKADIQAKQAELQAEFEAKQYARSRTARDGENVYPSIPDQLDMQFHDQVNGTTTWKDAIQAIKDANPK